MTTRHPVTVLRAAATVPGPRLRLLRGHDHAPNLFVQRMTDEKMLAQRAQVRRLDGRS